MSTDAWFRDFERQDSYRMERIEDARARVAEFRGTEVHHIDGDALNNDPTNLKLVRAPENREHYALQDQPRPSAPPFLPGDLIVPIVHPETGAVTVSVVVVRGRGNWRVGYRGTHGDTGSAPASAYVKAPDGWVDAPPYPAGSVRLGLDEADRQAALAADAANVELQQARLLWEGAMLNWHERWGRHPAILAARGEKP